MTTINRFEVISQFASIYGGKVVKQDNLYCLDLLEENIKVRKLTDLIDYIDVNEEFIRFVEFTGCKPDCKALNEFLKQKTIYNNLYLIKVKNIEKYFNGFSKDKAPKFTTNKLSAQKFVSLVGAKTVSHRLGKNYEIINLDLTTTN